MVPTIYLLLRPVDKRSWGGNTGVPTRVDVRLLIRSSHRKGKQNGEKGREKRREMSERPNGQDQWIKAKT